MNQKKNSEQVQLCIDEQKSKFDAYYQTVMISVGLKHIFNENEPCSFKINEPSMKSNGREKPVTPDAIFQCDNDKKGIVAEIKTSLPDNEDLLLKDTKEQLEKYSKIEGGWKPPTKKGGAISQVDKCISQKGKKFVRLVSDSRVYTYQKGFTP